MRWLRNGSLATLAAVGLSAITQRCIALDACPRSSAYTQAIAYLNKHQPQMRAREIEPGAWEHFFYEPEWPEVDHFLPGFRFLVYPEHFFRRRSSEALNLLAVHPSCEVEPLDMPSLRGLMKYVKDKIVTEADADELGRLLLKLRNIQAVYQEGLPEGDYIIDALDDITFRDESERNTVAQTIEVELPSVTMKNGGFEWKFMTWDKIGMGGIAVNSLVVDFQTGVDLKRRYLAHKVGVYQAIY